MNNKLIINNLINKTCISKFSSCVFPQKCQNWARKQKKIPVWPHPHKILVHRQNPRTNPPPKKKNKDEGLS